MRAQDIYLKAAEKICLLPPPGELIPETRELFACTAISRSSPTPSHPARYVFEKLFDPLNRTPEELGEYGFFGHPEVPAHQDERQTALCLMAAMAATDWEALLNWAISQEEE